MHSEPQGHAPTEHCLFQHTTACSSLRRCSTTKYWSVHMHSSELEFSCVFLPHQQGHTPTLISYSPIEGDNNRRQKLPCCIMWDLFPKKGHNRACLFSFLYLLPQVLIMQHSKWGVATLINSGFHLCYLFGYNHLHKEVKKREGANPARHVLGK